MAHSVVVRGIAQAEAADAAEYYELQRSGDAARFMAAFAQLLTDLAATPGLCGRVPRSPAGTQVRQCLLRPFTRLVTYQVTPTAIIVLSVHHARQRRQPWRRRMGP